MRLEQAMKWICSGEQTQHDGLQELPGGRNNTVYLYTGDRERLCIKRYKKDLYCRAEKEWAALQGMKRHGIGFTPKPVEFLDRGPEKFVVTEYIPGEGLGHTALTADQLEQLQDCLNKLYALKPDEAGIGPVHCNAAAMLGRVQSFYDRLYGRDFSGVVQEAYRNSLAWLASGEARRLAEEPGELVFSRGDPNLANCLWDGSTLRMIDFEYAGWSDKAYDLADLVEHPLSFGTVSGAWDAFVESFTLSQESRQRYAASRKLLSLFWLSKLWPSGGTPGDAVSRDRFDKQYNRFRLLSGGV